MKTGTSTLSATKIENWWTGSSKLHFRSQPEVDIIRSMSIKYPLQNFIYVFICIRIDFDPKIRFNRPVPWLTAVENTFIWKLAVDLVELILGKLIGGHLVALECLLCMIHLFELFDQKFLHAPAHGSKLKKSNNFFTSMFRKLHSIAHARAHKNFFLKISNRRPLKYAQKIKG